jgi:hypothetical protein
VVKPIIKNTEKRSSPFIRNRPLPDYIKAKDTIVLKYQGASVKSLINTIFLGLAVYHHLDDSWKICISCDQRYESWIPYPLSYYHPTKSDSYFISYYNITNNELNNDNHLDVAKYMKLPVPLEGTSILFDNQIPERKNSVLICTNGITQYSLSYGLERDLYYHFVNKNKEVQVAIPLDYHHSDFWKPDAIKPSDLNQMIRLVSEYETIICMDNDYLTLANACPRKKVIGCFGPTTPKSSLRINSMKILQLYDDDQKFVSKKFCPCIDPRSCHRGYALKTTPFCFNVSSQILIKKIESLIV